MSEVDPEVEWLARGDVRNAVASLIPDETGRAIQSATDAIVGRILADLRERYILVPRMSWGFQPTQEWPPEVTSAPLSAQNGPDDSQEGK